MRFGQLVTSTARKPHYCNECESVIEEGEHYAAILYVKVGVNKKTFTSKAHMKCLVSYIETRETQRKAVVGEKRRQPGGKGGRPRVTGSPEEAKARILVQHNIWKRKNKLVIAYESGNEELIRSRWLGLADVLEQYAGIGGEYYSLGKEISERVKPKPVFVETLANCNRSPAGMAQAIKEEWAA